ncbi:MAG: hypothetical protein V8S39_07950 [Lachnospiraceae bacterium]
MPKQNNAAEEDYLDNLLNSVLKNDGGEEIPDDIFRDDLKELAGSDDDFFSNIEKGWMKDPSQSESSRLPEKVAKEELKKQEDIENNRAAEKKAGSGELQNAPESEKTQGNQESEEQQGTQESEKTQGNQESEEQQGTQESSEDDMMGLYDILGVTPENAGEDTAGIEDLEKSDRSSKKKKKKRKLFGRKKREDTAEEQKVDLALDLMQNGQKEAEALPEKADEQEKATGSEENTSEEAEENTPQMEGQPEGTPGAAPEDETESINSLISDSGLGEGLDDIPEKTDEPEEEQPAEDKKKKKKKEKKKKPKKQKKPKQKKPKKPKKEKKPKEPKGPEEIIKVPIPFLIFLLSVGALMVLGVLFGGSYYQYQTGISNATTYYVNQKYGQAYDELYHLDIKKDDEYFYGQVNTVMQVYANYRSYAELIKIGNYTDALDSLLNGVRMFDKYKDIARDEYNCYNDLSQALTWIDTALQDVYGITESEAREINLGGKKLAYSKRVAEIAGQAERKDAQTDDSDN